MENEKQRTGKVTLVGAGPGDKGLLTLKGAEKIRLADVVLFDRHVGAEILAMIPKSAESIDVGKNAGRHPVPQDEINLLLLEKVRQGKNVVRLKGGDPFVFGRGGEELEFLSEFGIAFEVVPGVTSAVAGAAYAGIPVTHRDHASSMHIITGHAKRYENPDINFEALVSAGGTLVFMMGVAAVESICDGCISAGLDKDMPAAIIEKATTSEQRKFIATVGTLAETTRENSVSSPAVIIIGTVCLLSERLDWFSKKPPSGRRVMVARVTPGPSRLSQALMALGFHVDELQCAKIEPLTGPGCDLVKALDRINDYSWLVFTSGVGVNVFFDHLIESGFDIRSLSHLKIACVGPETEKETGKRGIRVDYRPEVFNGAELARGLAGLVNSGDKLLIARDKNGAGDLTSTLSDNGVAFDDIAVYEKRVVDDVFLHKGVKIKQLQYDFAAFTSSSGVQGFVKAAVGAAGLDLKEIRAVCIGEKTAETARAYGMQVFVSEESTIESMVNKFKELCV